MHKGVSKVLLISSKVSQQGLITLRDPRDAWEVWRDQKRTPSGLYRIFEGIFRNPQIQMPISPRGSSCRYSPQVPNVLGLLAGEKLATSVDILQNRQGIIQKQI